MPFDDDLIEVVTPERVELNFPIAGLGSRFAAAFIDLIIIILLNVLLSLLWLIFIAALQTEDFYPLSIAIGFWITLRFLVTFGYYIYLEYKWNGQTPGKRIMHIRVMRYGGLPVDLASSAIRNLMRIVDILLFSFAIGFLILFLSKLSQRPGDFAAGTIVVRDRSITLADLDHYLKSTSGKQANNNAKLDARFQKLNDEDARVIEMFMSRKHQLQLSQRREMSEQIANGIREKLGIKKDEYGSDEILIRTANNALKSRQDKW
ncbi:RDD family protein [bacterium]|nr:RDD family protein [bacterium]